MKDKDRIVKEKGEKAKLKQQLKSMNSGSDSFGIYLNSQLFIQDSHD